jgi:hypothetical protein
MLERLTVESFRDRVGETFRVLLDERRELHLRLAAIHVWGTGAAAVASRQPFTLTFSAPGPGMLPQGTYAVEHETLGHLELFLVPVGSNGESVDYEAVFS